MIEFFKVLLSKDDVIIGLAIGALVSAMFYKLRIGVWPKGWNGDETN